MKVYEIVNPSDYATFEAESDLVADLAMLLLGLGKTPPKAVDGSFQGAFWLMGTTEEGIKRYFKEEHGRDEEFGDLLLEFSPQIAAALESAILGDRQLYQEAVALIEEGKRDEFRTKWQDRHRTSMNDIVRCSLAWAGRIRAKITKEQAT